MPSAQYMYVPAPPSLTVHAHGTHANAPPPFLRSEPLWHSPPA
jgi:hypothetical protein